MSIQSSIHNFFGENAFKRPVFYSNPGGLRFELSEGGDWLSSFDSAFRRCQEICNSIFTSEFVLCIRIYSDKSLVSSVSVIKELRSIGLYPNVEKEHWSEPDDDDDDWLGSEGRWHTIAFKLPVSELDKVIWCSMASDLNIKPSPTACFYLFDLERGVEVWPYDDRGMDVVGRDYEFLKELYLKYNSYLLDYDREIMNASFK